MALVPSGEFLMGSENGSMMKSQFIRSFLTISIWIFMK